MDKIEEFEGRSVYYHNGYPAVSWKDHPASSGGTTYLHRIIGYRIWGEDIFGKVVHHKDGDRSNFSPSNLELMDHTEHNNHHHSTKVEAKCDRCEETFVRPQYDLDRREGTYCSHECYYLDSERIDWPSDKELENMVWEKPKSQLAEDLGVSDKAIEKRCKKKDIDMPGRGYWQKKRAGKL